MSSTCSSVEGIFTGSSIVEDLMQYIDCGMRCIASIAVLLKQIVSISLASILAKKQSQNFERQH